MTTKRARFEILVKGCRETQQSLERSRARLLAYVERRRAERYRWVSLYSASVREGIV